MKVNKLREIRKEKGMTIQELSDISGVSIGYICHLERGTRKNPSRKIMEKISNALGKTMVEIFF